MLILRNKHKRTKYDELIRLDQMRLLLKACLTHYLCECQNQAGYFGSNDHLPRDLTFSIEAC